MLAVTLVVLLSLLFVVTRVHDYYRLAHIPGPRLSGWSRVWMLWSNTSGRNHEHLYNVNLKYGSLARIGPNHLLTSDADVIRRMNAPRSPYRRSIWYTTFRFKPRADNIISVVSEERHEELRKRMAGGYSGKELPHLEQHIDNHIEEWVRCIRKKYLSTSQVTKPMDIGRSAQYFTLDVISDIAFSHPFGDIAGDMDKFSYIKTTEDAVGVMAAMSIFPHVHRWIEQSRIIDILAPKAKDKTGLGPIVGLVERIVSERFENLEQKGKQDMLDSFIRHGMKRDEVVSEAVLQIMAGSDTSATVIRVVLLYVITSPLIFGKLRKEIDDGIDDGQISSPIRDSEARLLPYLQACINEALRLWPPVTGILQKIVAPEGDIINGVFVPGGTFIGQCAWATGRDSIIYGADFAIFRPERWLEASGEQLHRMERNAELTFGYGRFKCLGRPVALMELNKVFVELLRVFDISVINPSQPWSSDSRGIFLQKDFWVRITEREEKRV